MHRSTSSRVIGAAAVVSAALALASCTSAGSGGGGSSSVYFIFNGYTPPYFAPMAQGIKDAQKHFSDMKIKILSANGSASTEINQIKQAQAAGAKGIILNAIDGSVTAAAKQVSGKVPVVTIDRDVTDPSARVAFIGDDDKKLGAQLASSCLSGLKAAGLAKPWNIIDLQGTQGASTAVDRETGIQSVLKPLVAAGRAKVVLDQSADFATDKAQTQIAEALSKSAQVSAIIAANDAMALGAINALKSARLAAGKHTIVCGADAQPESLIAIRAGTQYNTVTHAPYVEAFWAVEAMSNYLKNKTTPPSKYANGVVVVPQVIVTKANVASVGAWGTPKSVDPLPYGTAKSYQAG